MSPILNDGMRSEHFFRNVQIHIVFLVLSRILRKFDFAAWLPAVNPPLGSGNTACIKIKLASILILKINHKMKAIKINFQIGHWNEN